MSTNQGILVPDNTSALPAQTAPTVNLSAMFERLALADIDVNKLQALMDMQRQILRDQSEMAFNVALGAAQQAMRPVAADAENPQTRSRYASYAALDKALRPIYTQHGFNLSFDTEDSPLADHIRVVCYVGHSAGHSRKYRVDMPSDGKGARGGDVMTKTHAAGAAMSYGMRYLVRMIWNVSVGEDDRDGNSAVPRPAPDGFDIWWDDLRATADEGQAALKAAWKASPEALRNYVVEQRAREWEQVKAKAAKVKA